MSLSGAFLHARAQIGAPPLTSRWFALDQARISAFADVTGDWQFIHVDPDKAATTPFGGTIAHGFLTLAMISAMYADVATLPDGVTQAINYGFDKIRFVAPVPSGARIRGRFSLTSVTQEQTYLSQTFAVDVEVENTAKPAVVAVWLNRLYFPARAT